MVNDPVEEVIDERSGIGLHEKRRTSGVYTVSWSLRSIASISSTLRPELLERRCEIDPTSGRDDGNRGGLVATHHH